MIDQEIVIRIIALVVFAALVLPPAIKRYRELRREIEDRKRKEEEVHLQAANLRAEKQAWFEMAKAQGYEEPRNRADQYRDNHIYGGRLDIPFDVTALEAWLIKEYEFLPSDIDSRIIQLPHLQLGLALISLGRKDFIQVVADKIPAESPGMMRELKSYFKYFVPLPEHLNNFEQIRNNPAAFDQWLNENIDDMQWDEEQGRFVLNKPDRSTS